VKVHTAEDTEEKFLKAFLTANPEEDRRIRPSRSTTRRQLLIHKIKESIKNRKTTTTTTTSIPTVTYIFQRLTRSEVSTETTTSTSASGKTLIEREAVQLQRMTRILI
jgi:hypothetical protein